MICQLTHQTQCTRKYIVRWSAELIANKAQEVVIDVMHKTTEDSKDAKRLIIIETDDCKNKKKGFI
jgi:hypothetical protein